MPCSHQHWWRALQAPRVTSPRSTMLKAWSDSVTASGLNWRDVQFSFLSHSSFPQQLPRRPIRYDTNVCKKRDVVRLMSPQNLTTFLLCDGFLWLHFPKSLNTVVQFPSSRWCNWATCLCGKHSFCTKTFFPRDGWHVNAITCFNTQNRSSAVILKQEYIWKYKLTACIPATNNWIVQHSNIRRRSQTTLKQHHFYYIDIHWKDILGCESISGLYIQISDSICRDQLWYHFNSLTKPKLKSVSTTTINCFEGTQRLITTVSGSIKGPFCTIRYHTFLIF